MTRFDNPDQRLHGEYGGKRARDDPFVVSVVRRYGQSRAEVFLERGDGKNAVMPLVFSSSIESELKLAHGHAFSAHPAPDGRLLSHDIERVEISPLSMD